MWPWVVVALVVGLVAGVGGAYALAGLGERPLTTLTYGPGGDMPDFDVSYGYCYLGVPGPGRTVDSGASRNCDQTHDSQVFGRVQAYESSIELDYPDGALQDAGIAFCRLYFDTAVVGADRDELVLSLVMPSEQAFEQDNRAEGASTANYTERSMYCVLNSPDGRQLEGTRLAEAFDG